MSETTGRENFEALMARTNPARPGAEDVEQLRQMLKGSGSILPFAGGLAQQSQQVLLNSIKLSAASREVIEANLARLQEALERDGTSPLEKLLTENILLCSLRYYLWECAYHVQMANSSDPGAAKEWEVMLNQAQKRYLRAVETLARVRRLAIAVQVNIATDGGQQVNVMALDQKKKAGDS